MNNVSLISHRMPVSAVSSTDGPRFVTFRRGKTDWTAETHLLDEVFDDRGLRLDEWLRCGRAEIVKDGAHRTVYRLDLACGRFYLKHYRTPRLRNLLLNLVRACRANLEHLAAQRVAAQGVATYETVAIGRQRTGPFVSDSFLLTRAIDDTIPLDELIQERDDRSDFPLPPRTRQRLAVQLGTLVAQMHAGGLVHRDLHAGNVLARVTEDDSVRLWLIDPWPMSRRIAVGLRTIASNLALLNNFLAPYATRTDRRRFFRSYWRTLRSLGKSRVNAKLVAFAKPPRAVVEQIEACCATRLQACHRRNDRKWITGNRRIIIAETSARKCRAIAAIGKQQAAHFRDEPGLLFTGQFVREWHENTSARKSACVNVTLNGMIVRGCAVMFETAADGRNSSGLQWNSQVRQIWEAGHALLRRSLKCPRPLLFVEAGIEAGKTRQYLLTELLLDTVPLTNFLSGAFRLGEAAREQLLCSCALKLARGIRWMHECGIDHEAPTADNLLVDNSGPQIEIVFWQLEAVRLRRSVSKHRTHAALACLHDSIGAPARHSHRVRFLRHYLRDRFRAEWKSCWRAVARISRHRQNELATPTSAFSYCTQQRDIVETKAA